MTVPVFLFFFFFCNYRGPARRRCRTARPGPRCARPASHTYQPKTPVAGQVWNVWRILAVTARRLRLALLPARRPDHAPSRANYRCWPEGMGSALSCPARDAQPRRLRTPRRCPSTTAGALRPTHGGKVWPGSATSPAFQTPERIRRNRLRADIPPPARLGAGFLKGGSVRDSLPRIDRRLLPRRGGPRRGARRPIVMGPKTMRYEAPVVVMQCPELDFPPVPPQIDRRRPEALHLLVITGNDGLHTRFFAGARHP